MIQLSANQAKDAIQLIDRGCNAEVEALSKAPGNTARIQAVATVASQLIKVIGDQINESIQSDGNSGTTSDDASEGISKRDG